MAQAPAESIPSFWSEPWRGAAPAWRRGYGAPARDFDGHAARLIYSGWGACFGLSGRWCSPSDPRWLSLVCASPAVLEGVVSVLGYIALVRARVPGLLACRPPIDWRLAFALKYRDVRCMRSTLLAPRQDSFDPYVNGVHVLCVMARDGWPAVESRIAMLAPPPASRAGNDAGELTQAAIVTIEWVDVDRCLSLCGAVVRHMAAQTASRGAR